MGWVSDVHTTVGQSTRLLAALCGAGELTAVNAALSWGWSRNWSRSFKRTEVTRGLSVSTIWESGARPSDWRGVSAVPLAQLSCLSIVEATWPNEQMRLGGT